MRKILTVILLGLTVAGVAVGCTGCEARKTVTTEMEIMETTAATTGTVQSENIFAGDQDGDTEDDVMTEKTDTTEDTEAAALTECTEEYSEPESSYPEIISVQVNERSIYQDIGEYDGNLTIPDVGIDVSLYYDASNDYLQEIVDRQDSAAVFMGPVQDSTCIIGDHSSQEFGSLLNVMAGTKAYVYNPDGSITELVCVSAFNGYNLASGIPYDIVDQGYDTVYGITDVVMYTCNGDSYNIWITLWMRA